MKLDIKAFAISCGLLWGVSLFILTWWIIAFEGATGEVTMIGMLYRGYTISPVGSMVGVAWGLVDGFFGGLILAWLYNALVGKLECGKKQDASN